MIHELTEMVMSNVGLDVDSNFNVIDQDYGNQIIFGDKCLKCSYNHQEPFIGRNDIYFELTQNVKLMIFTFSYFLQKSEIMNQLYIMTYCQLNNGNNDTALQIQGDINITSNYYKSDTLKYMDIIFRLCGYPNVDFLKLYDTMVR